MFRFFDFRAYFTFLGHNKGYTAINFFGLSLALAMILLISTYTIRSLSTDRYHEKIDRIHIFTNGEQTYSAYFLSKHLRDRFPEVEAGTILTADAGNVWIGSNRDQFSVQMLMADSSVFNIFSLEMVEGSEEEFATGHYRKVIVSERFARQLVGDSGLSVIGQPLLFQDPTAVAEQEVWTICGVMRDIEHSTIPACDIMVRAELLPLTNSSHNERMDNAGAGMSCLLLAPNVDVEALEAKMLEACKEFYWVYREGHYDKVKLLPFADHYFTQMKASPEFNKGNRDFVLVLFSVAFVLLLFALINYINLTMAQTGLRAKEMATRRLLGASKSEVMMRMIGEAVLFALLSAFVALCLAEWATPLACRLLAYEYTIWSEMSFGYVTIALGCVLAIGVVSGLLPAWSISTYKPIDVVKGAFRTRSKMLYGRIFIALQHTITVIMLVAAGTIYLQIRHQINMPLGYNTEDIFVVENTDLFSNRQEVKRFVDELKKLPCVEAVGVGNGVPLEGTNNITFKSISFQQIRGDSAYFNILGLRIKTPSNSAEEAWGVTELAFRTLGVDESVNRLEFDGKKLPVGDIYYDFRLFHTYREQTPALLYNAGEWNFERSMPWTTVIRTHGDHTEAVKAIREMLATTHPHILWSDEYSCYLTDRISELFEEQVHLQRIVTIFTLLAAIISALGLLAISTDYIGQRRQEIAIRKVMGATSAEIVKQLVESFLRMVAVGAVVALPLAWWLMSRWLQDYSYRIEMPVWVFVAAVVAVLVFALLTVLWQSRKAANENPVDSIKE